MLGAMKKSLWIAKSLVESAHDHLNSQKYWNCTFSRTILGSKEQITVKGRMPHEIQYWSLVWSLRIVKLKITICFNVLQTWVNYRISRCIPETLCFSERFYNNRCKELLSALFSFSLVHILRFRDISFFFNDLYITIECKV